MTELILYHNPRCSKSRGALELLESAGHNVSILRYLETPPSADELKKHEDFVNRMVQKGYTPKQVRLLCEWYLRVRKSS